MIVRSSRWFAALCLMLACCTQAAAAAALPVRVVVSFSILADIVRRIGGGEVAVTSLIGPDSDAHVFEPNPDQARLLAKAQLFVVNGLGFEGWLTRLTRSAQFGGVVVTATDGVTPITTTEPGETSPLPPKFPNIQSRAGGVGPPRAQRIGRGPSRQAAGDHQP
jgi:ABC-type Zn uptake system ZnuABC Zn-binding protein ZnuA